MGTSLLHAVMAARMQNGLAIIMEHVLIIQGCGGYCCVVASSLYASMMQREVDIRVNLV
jgi:hypothetical protein